MLALSKTKKELEGERQSCKESREPTEHPLDGTGCGKGPHQGKNPKEGQETGRIFREHLSREMKL